MTGLLELLGKAAQAPSRLATFMAQPGIEAGQGMRLKMAEKLAELQARLDENKATANQARAGTAYGKAAAALNLNAPDIGYLSLLAKADPQAASQALATAANSRTPLGQQQLTNAQQTGEMNTLQIEGQKTSNKAAELGYRQSQQLFPLQLEQARQSIAASQSQIAASGLSADAQKLTFYNTVRGQFQALPAIKTAVEAQGAYKAGIGSASQGSSLGARIALVKLAKLADPTSVVREGEVDSIKQGYGVMSQLDAALRAAGDKGMSTAVLKIYQDAMDALYLPAMEQAARATREYWKLEDQYGARPGEFTATTGLDWSAVPGQVINTKGQAPATVRQWAGK